jgi:ABC-type cobalamin/Fe3+-siderophores transport system ATPase subunit
VILFRGGRIVADGAKDSVLTAGRLSEIFGVKARIEQKDGYFHLF